MKNLYIFNINSRGALYGIGTYLVNLIEYGKKRGMAVHIVELNATEKELFVKTVKGIRYIKIPGPSYPVNVNYKECLKKLQISSCFILKGIINNDEENVFHLNRMEFLELAKGLKENFNGKIVLTVHYTEWSRTLLGNKKKLNRIIRKNPENLLPDESKIYEEVKRGKELINSYCDKVIAISQHSYNDIISVYRANPEKVFLVNNALKDSNRSIPDDNKNEIQRKYFIAEDEIVLIFAGRLDEVKGIYILIDAFAKVLKHNPNCRLLIAGSGNFEPIIDKSGDISSKISYMGFVPKKELYRLYFIADIGVVPSIHEEFGYVAIEMMMHGLPVVASNSTGLAEIVENRITGLTFEVKNGKKNIKKSPYDLAEKLLLLINNRSLCEEYGKNGRKRFVDHYDIKTFNKKITNVYKDFNEF